MVYGGIQIHDLTYLLQSCTVARTWMRWFAHLLMFALTEQSTRI